MSENLPLNNDETFEKEVNMVAYAPEDVSDWRTWLQPVVDDDLQEKTSSTERDWEMEINPNGSDNDYSNFTRSLDTWNVDEEVAQKMCEDLEGVDNIEMVYEEDTVENFKISPRNVTDDIINSVIEGLPQQLSGGLSKLEGWMKWDDSDNHEFQVRIHTRGVDDKRVLSKESEREDDDMYETLGERKCISLVIRIKAPSQEYIDTWTKEIIPELHKGLSKLEPFSKVRYMACTTNVTREGECYNI